MGAIAESESLLRRVVPDDQGDGDADVLEPQPHTGKEVRA